MPRTVPSAITAKQGSGALFFIWLVELHLSSGTQYFSSGQQVTFGGHVYTANRVKSINDLTAQYIDYKRHDFSGATIVLDNRADDGSANFYFTGIEGAVNMEDAEVFVHCFDVDANTGVDAAWWGRVKSREYDDDPADPTVSITCSFLWDSQGIVVPSSTLQQESFGTLDTGQVKDSVIDETGLPLVYGAGGFKIRPTIYESKVVGNRFYVNGVISGCGTTPFQSTDIVGMTLFESTPALSFNFDHHGQAVDPVPTDLTAYPDGLAHNYVAYFNAVFSTDGIEDKLDNIQPDDIKLSLANGRPLIDTTLPSQNGVLIIKDVLQDPRFGLGFNSFDDLTSSANTVGTLWQCRLEQHDQVAIGDFLQQCLTQIQGYLTFNNRLLQIGIKTGSEASVATFSNATLSAPTTITLNGGTGLSITLDTATGVYTYVCGGVVVATGTMDSISLTGAGGSATDTKGGRTIYMEWNWVTGIGTAYRQIGAVQSCQITDSSLTGAALGRMICDDRVHVSFESSDDLINQVNASYRLANRHPRKVIAYDGNAQGRAGGTIRKVNKQDYEFNLLFDRSQVAIAAAMIIREEQNANMIVEFKSPLPESLSVAPGDLVTVINSKIPNNSVNRVFRVIAQTFSTGDIPDVTFRGRLYVPSVYDYSTTGIGVDPIRPGSDDGQIGRPPDVSPVSLVVVDKVANDTQGVMAQIRATWTYPAGNLVRKVQLYWRYLDEGVNEWKLGKEISYPTTTGDFYVDFLKSKSVQCAFVALGLSESHGALGYVPDPTKISALTSNLSATGATALIGDSGPFTAGDYTRTEFELDKVNTKATGQLNFVTSSGNRAPQFDTVAIAHPAKTQIAVAKQNYPTLTLALTAARFTYPAVTALVLHQRKENISVRITDVSAENLEDYFLYWTTSASFAGDATKLGSVTPAWYLADPTAPPAGINVISGKAVRYPIPQEDIGGAGVVIYGRVAARNGKHNWSVQLSPLANNSAGDDALPVATAPKLIIKKRGVRVREILPATNVKTLKKIEIVIEARNGAGTVLGYLSDSTGLGDWQSNATEFRFDQGLQPAHTYLGKAETLALWPTAATLKIRCYLTNDVGTSTVSADSTVLVSTWELEGSITPGTLAFPGGLTVNTVDGDPEKNLARVAITLATSNGLSFAANNISGLSFTLVERNDANTANVGKYQTPVFSVQNSTAVTIDVEDYLRMGRRFRIDGVVAMNGDKAATTTGTLDFIAGAVRVVDPADTKVVPAPSFGTISREDGSNKIDIVPLSLSQDGADIVFFKRLDFEVNINGAGWNLDKGNSFGLKAEDALYTGVSASKTWNLRVKRKAGVTAQYRATAIAVGTKASATTTSAVQGALTGDVLLDSGVPTGLTAPAVEQSDGHVFVTCATPTSQINTLGSFQVVMSTQSTAPAGTPTVGAEGVVKIKQGQTVSFKAKRPQDVDLYFYYRVPNLVGYSSWSSGTTLLTTGVTRPLLDFVGSSAPAGDEGLVYTSNSGTGHTTTRFYLDSGASSVDGFYVGNALNVPTPGASSPDADTWRTVTAYVGSTREVTVDVAFSSAPVGSKLFAVHKIGIAGDRATRSGTGHTNITFVLDAGASAATDFYKAFTLYVPSVPNGAKRARKVLSYNGTTKELALEGAFGSTPSGQLGYLLVNGSIGYATPNDAQNKTGLVSPVPFRWYLDGPTDQLVFQILPPTVEGISLEHFQLRCRRENVAAAVKFDSGAVPILSGLGTQTAAPLGNTYAGSVRFHSLYRAASGPGLDGWGPESYHVDLPRSQFDTVTAGAPNNDPEQYGPALLIDYEGPSSYPNKILTY